MKFNGMAERYWQSAVDDMYEKRLTDVLRPCRKCKGIVKLDPFEGGTFKAHLLMHGFMHVLHSGLPVYFHHPSIDLHDHLRAEQIL